MNKLRDYWINVKTTDWDQAYNFKHFCVHSHHFKLQLLPRSRNGKYLVLKSWHRNNSYFAASLLSTALCMLKRKLVLEKNLQNHLNWDQIFYVFAKT